MARSGDKPEKRKAIKLTAILLVVLTIFAAIFAAIYFVKQESLYESVFIPDAVAGCIEFYNISLYSHGRNFNGV